MKDLITFILDRDLAKIIEVVHYISTGVDKIYLYNLSPQFKAIKWHQRVYLKDYG